MRADPQTVREGTNWDVKIEEGYREKPSEVDKAARAPPDAKSDAMDTPREEAFSANANRGWRAKLPSQN